jgi:hypothetical protein
LGVIVGSGALEDAGDYKAFASLLWRLHRATTIETGLFEIQANHLTEVKRGSQFQPTSQEVVYALFRRSDAVDVDRDPAADCITKTTEKKCSARDRNRSSLTSTILSSSRVASCVC